MVGQYFCKNEHRRALILNQSRVNGVDFVEIDPDQRTLHVNFFFAVPSNALTEKNFVIEGGERVTGIAIRPGSLAVAAKVATFTTSAAGDFSTYTLRLVKPGTSDPPDDFDPAFCSIDFSFKVNCPSDFDCQTLSTCEPSPIPGPNINYLAKDYESFRQLILDRMAVTTPAWRERSPADLGVALVELLAYAGDQLSYYQDAVATEAYLGTARRRASIRRHARLLDYFMHDGCNARCFVFFEAPKGVKLTIPAGAQLLTRVAAAPNLPREGLVQLNQQRELTDRGALAFRMLANLLADPNLNEIRFWTWSDSRCCLPKGATSATLQDLASGDLALSKGDLLLFEEIKGAGTGLAEDADPKHRHVVRMMSPPLRKTDPLTGQKLIEIAWDVADALPFPLCLSSATSPETGSQAISDVSVARGNIALAEHALAREPEALPAVASDSAPYRYRLQNSDVSIATIYEDATARSRPAAGLLTQDPRSALPNIKLSGAGEWSVRRDLLDSGPSALDFVVEIEEDLGASLRFGDGVLGAKAMSGLIASYATGNGSAGNIGADALAYVVASPGAILSAGVKVRNPLPAQGGVDPETLDETRAFAPQAFRTQQRAVTAADYAAIAERHPQVRKAQATLRWTGSWHTMFVTIERTGGLPVDASFGAEVRDYLESFRLAGYDLEIEAPQYVSLDIAFTVCVASGYFRGEVKAALADAFSNRILPNGTAGFFYPGNFTFGQPVYISAIVATAMRVPGVQWIDIKDTGGAPNHFMRLGQAAPRGEAAVGRIEMASLEIARLDNDPSRPENGKIAFLMAGGA